MGYLFSRGVRLTLLNRYLFSTISANKKSVASLKRDYATNDLSQKRHLLARAKYTAGAIFVIPSINKSIGLGKEKRVMVVVDQ